MLLLVNMFEGLERKSRQMVLLKVILARALDPPATSVVLTHGHMDPADALEHRVE